MKMTYTKRTSESLAGLNPKARVILEAFINKIPAVLPPGITFEVISGLRTAQVQNGLYAIGRTIELKKRKVTNAKAWESYHNYGLAIDLGLFGPAGYLDEKSPKLADSIYKSIGVLAKESGVEAAMYWKTFQETPHFQVAFGMGIKELQKRIKEVNYDVTKLF